MIKLKKNNKRKYRQPKGYYEQVQDPRHIQPASKRPEIEIAPSL